MGLSEFFWNLGAWNWFIVAVALFALESVVPGVHFVWFGIAAVLDALSGRSPLKSTPCWMHPVSLASPTPRSGSTSRSRQNVLSERKARC